MHFLRPSYALVAVAKLKAKLESRRPKKDESQPALISDACDHELRLKIVSNADPSRRELNRLILFSRSAATDDLSFQEAEAKGLLRTGLFTELIAGRMRELGIYKVQTNAVHAQQVQLSASHAFFDRAADGAPILNDRYKSWRGETVKFLQSKFPDGLVGIVEHLDETTPHLTGVVVPVVSKAVKARGKWGRNRPAAPPQWRLCAADLFNPFSIRKIWTDYATAVKPFGLVRPPQALRVPYTTVAEFYQALAAAENTAKDDFIPSFGVPPVSSKFFIKESAESYKSKVEAEAKRFAQTLERLVVRMRFHALAAQRVMEREALLRVGLEHRDKEIAELRAQTDQLKLRLEERNRVVFDVHAAELFRALGLKGMRADNETHIVHADLPDGRKVSFAREGAFEISSNSKISKRNGQGTIEFLMALFQIDLFAAESKALQLLGGRAIGPIVDRLIRKFKGSAPNEGAISKMKVDLRLIETNESPKNVSLETSSPAPKLSISPNFNTQIERPRNQAGRSKE